MRILLTGSRGYIGTVMGPIMVRAGHEVVGVDTDLYRRSTFGVWRESIHTIQQDVRSLEAADLDGFDAVVHLAALSNDPLNDLNPELTYVELVKTDSPDARTIIMAEERAPAVLGDDYATRWTRVGRFSGTELVGARYRRPLDWVAYPEGSAHEVIVGEGFVQADSGSGETWVVASPTSACSMPASTARSRAGRSGCPGPVSWFR